MQNEELGSFDSKEVCQFGWAIQLLWSGQNKALKYIIALLAIKTFV
jgi:hypothetical protein